MHRIWKAGVGHETLSIIHMSKPKSLLQNTNDSQQIVKFVIRRIAFKSDDFHWAAFKRQSSPSHVRWIAPFATLARSCKKRENYRDGWFPCVSVEMFQMQFYLQVPELLESCLADPIAVSAGKNESTLLHPVQIGPEGLGAPFCSYRTASPRCPSYKLAEPNVHRGRFLLQNGSPSWPLVTKWLTDFARLASAGSICPLQNGGDWGWLYSHYPRIPGK